MRAARKLIDVTKVPAIMGTWASAVTTAVAPLCWESKTFLTTVSGADSITQLPHQGYLIRTQPNNHLQAAKHAEFIAVDGRRSACFMMSIQAPFAEPTQERATEVLKQKGSQMVGTLIYDKDKTTLSLRGRPGAAHQARSHLSQRLCAGRDGPAARPLPRQL